MMLLRRRCLLLLGPTPFISYAGEWLCGRRPCRWARRSLGTRRVVLPAQLGLADTGRRAGAVGGLFEGETLSNGGFDRS